MALPLIPVIIGIGSTIAGRIGERALLSVAIAVALKGLLITLLYVGLPIVLYNVYNRIAAGIIDKALSYMTGVDTSAVVVQLSGIAGWIASTMQLSDSLSIILTAVSVRFSLALVRL